MAAILNFRIFAKNGKTQMCEIERFRRNFRPTGYLRNVIFAIFKKFLLPKNGDHFEFSNFCQKQNTNLLLSP